MPFTLSSLTNQISPSVSGIRKYSYSPIGLFIRFGTNPRLVPFSCLSKKVVSVNMFLHSQRFLSEMYQRNFDLTYLRSPALTINIVIHL